jgi:hypothetical protein
MDTVVLRIKALHEDVSDMKDVLKELTAAINRLALVEERQAQTALALERAFAALTKVEDRLARLELAGVNSTRTSAMVDKGIWIIVTAIVVSVLSYLGIKK